MWRCKVLMASAQSQEHGGPLDAVVERVERPCPKHVWQRNEQGDERGDDPDRGVLPCRPRPGRGVAEEKLHAHPNTADPVAADRSDVGWCLPGPGGGHDAPRECERIGATLDRSSVAQRLTGEVI